MSLIAKETPKAPRESKIKYRYNGKPVPRVSDIIKEETGWSKDQLEYWMHWMWEKGEDPRVESQTAARIGDLAHDLIHCRITGKKADVKAYTKDEFEKAVKCYKHFVEWEREVRPEYLESEWEIVCKDYGGTLDLIIGQNDGLTLIDIKTGSYHKEHVVQLAAYKLLMENAENAPRMFEGINYAILRCSYKEQSYQWLSFSEKTMFHAECIFQNCLQNHEMKKLIKKERKSK